MKRAEKSSSSTAQHSTAQYSTAINSIQFNLILLSHYCYYDSSLQKVQANCMMSRLIRVFVSSSSVVRPISTSSSQYRSLLYRSKQRGWLELDLILGSWAEKNLASLSNADLIHYETLINKAENPDLMQWIINNQPPPKEFHSEVLTQIVHYAQSAEGRKYFKKVGNQ
jgi:succinate dehydrogenase flavin-adding protein (antitoxin of CptAB toxin-antitoxin module)